MIKNGHYVLSDVDVVTTHVPCGPFLISGLDSKPILSPAELQYIFLSWLLLAIPVSFMLKMYSARSVK